MKERAFDFFTYEDYQARFIFLFQNGYLRFPTFEEFSRTTVTLWFKLVMTPSRMGPLEQVLVQTYYMSKTNEVCNLLINVVIKKHFGLFLRGAHTYINWKSKVFYVVKVTMDLTKLPGSAHGHIPSEGRTVLTTDLFLNIILENVEISILNLKLDFY